MTTHGRISEDEISLREVFLKIGEWYRYLRRRRAVLAIAAIVGCLLGFAYSYFKKPYFLAETTFVLEEEKGGGLGQYAGIASMVGIDIGGGGKGGLFQGENIFELYRSRLMIEKTLLSRMGPGPKDSLLIDSYIAFNNLKEKFESDPKLSGIAFDIPREQFTVEHQRLLGSIVTDINKKYLTVEKPDENLSIISVKVKAASEQFAKAFAEQIVHHVNNFYIQTKTKKSLDNIRILQHQADSVRAVLNKSIRGSATAIDANPNANPALQILRVPSQSRQVDVQANTAIYAEVVKNLEIARISLRNETPLIQVIDKPILPLPEHGTNTILNIVLGGVVAAMLTAFFLLMRLFYYNIMSND